MFRTAFLITENSLTRGSVLSSMRAVNGETKNYISSPVKRQHYEYGDRAVTNHDEA